MDGPESLSSKSRGSMGCALGSGNLEKDSKNRTETNEMTVKVYTLSESLKVTYYAKSSFILILNQPNFFLERAYVKGLGDYVT